MDKYEYSVVYRNIPAGRLNGKYKTEEYGQILNEYGSQGWELVSTDCARGSTEMLLIFKRKLM